MPSKGQMDARLKQPLPVEQVPNLDVSYLTPNVSEACVNLQMDYILNRKSILTKWLFKSPLAISVLFAVFAIVYHYKLQDYLSAYAFKDGFLPALEKLFKNPNFRNDSIEALGAIGLATAVEWTFLIKATDWLRYESKRVPDHQKEYFGIDMSEYGALANKKRLNKEDKSQVQFMKTNSVSVIYRETPIAFIVKQVVDETDDKIEYKITGLGVRRVYVSAGVLEDLLTCTIRELKKVENKDVKCTLELYSFEEFDEKIATNLGFKLIKEQLTTKDLTLRLLFRVSKNTYQYEVARTN